MISLPRQCSNTDTDQHQHQPQQQQRHQHQHTTTTTTTAHHDSNTMTMATTTDNNNEGENATAKVPNINRIVKMSLSVVKGRSILLCTHVWYMLCLCAGRPTSNQLVIWFLRWCLYCAKTLILKEHATFSEFPYKVAICGHIISFWRCSCDSYAGYMNSCRLALFVDCLVQNY